MKQKFARKVDDLSFEKELQKVFFPQISIDAVEFRNNLTDEDIRHFGIDEKALQKQLAKLPKASVERADLGRKRRK